MVKKICPVCGRETDILIEGVCPDCYRKSHPILEVPSSLKVLRCSNCGALYINGRWVRGFRVLEKYVESRVKAKGVLEKVEVKIRPGLAEVKAFGKAHPAIPESYSEEYKVRLIYVNDLCPTCRAELTQHEEAVIQVRVIGRDASEYKDRVMDVVKVELVKNAERGRVIKVEDVERGFDIKVTNSKLARSLALAIHREFPSVMLEATKVVGSRGGRRISHKAYSIHLIALSKGEVVNINGEYYLVKSIYRNHLELVNVRSGLSTTLNYDKLVMANVVPVNEYQVSCVGDGVVVKVGEVSFDLRGIKLICP